MFELELEQPPPPSSGEGVGDGGGRRVVKMKDKNWTLDDDASNSSTRLVWKRGVANGGLTLKSDVVWRRRGGRPTAGERSGTEAPRGGRVLRANDLVRYSAKVSGTWRQRPAKFLKLAPMFRVIESSPSLTVVKAPKWPADDEENVTLFKLNPGELYWFAEPRETRRIKDDTSHDVFFYKLADGRGWVHDYVKNAPAIRRLEVLSIAGRPFAVRSRRQQRLGRRGLPRVPRDDRIIIVIVVIIAVLIVVVIAITPATRDSAASALFKRECCSEPVRGAWRVCVCVCVCARACLFSHMLAGGVGRYGPDVPAWARLPGVRRRHGLLARVARRRR